MKPISMSKVIDGVSFSTDNAILLAGNDLQQNQQRASFLYRGDNGYFIQTLSNVPEESNDLYPLQDFYAAAIYEGFFNRRVCYTEAFPNLCKKIA